MRTKRVVFVDFRPALVALGHMGNCRGVIMDKIKNINGKTVMDILQETGQEDSFPISLNKILQHYGISARAKDFSWLERQLTNRIVDARGRILGAMITNSAGDTTIFYSSDPILMSEHRYRFTIAHELAHACINGEPNHIEFRHDGTSNNVIEQQANIFAGELLIPLKQLEAVSEGLYIPSITNLAKVFEVSNAVMIARLEHLGRKDLYI